MRAGLYLVNRLNAKLNPICHLLALLGAHHILHVSRIRVNVEQAAVLGNIFQGTHDLSLRSPNLARLYYFELLYTSAGM